ncbi:MAG: hypothetical protein ACT4ON_15595 [Bacteroidota bacterium]
MKKLFTLLSIALVLNTVAFAQTKPAAKTPAKPKMTKADSALCGKDWKIVSVEEWGVVSKPPADNSKNDMLKLSLDGTYSIVMFGKPQSGTWTRSGQSLSLKGTAGFFKILAQEPAKLRLNHFSEEDGNSIFEYEHK